MKKKLFFVAILTIVLILAYNILGQITSALKAEERLQEAVEKLHSLEVKNKELKKKLEAVKTPDFIEREARDKLGLVREGETLVVIPDEKIKLVLNRERQEVEARLPNWLGWWRVFFK